MIEIRPDDHPASPTAAAAPVLGEDRRQVWREQLRLVVTRPSFLIGTLIVLVWIVCAVGGTHITPGDPTRTNEYPASLSPRASNWFGTDRLGRDVLSRVMAGARDVLIAAPLAALLGVVGGAVLGLLMGYFRGWIDEILGRLIDALLSIPVILIALLITSALGTSRKVVIITVAVLFTPIVARTVRAAVVSEAQLDYVAAAKLRGESSRFIMTREVLPNITAPIVVELTVRIGYAIFTISTLAFLGAGPAPQSPDWGNTIADNYDLIKDGQWWPTLFPALAIASLVVATNLIADSIEEVFAA